MRAVRCERQGPPEEMKLIDLPDPKPAAGEAVVRLHACGLNHRDVWIRQGLYARIQLPAILGSDGAGVVESVGAEADAKLVGKRAVIIPCEKWGPDPAVQSKEFLILGMPRQGTMAEKIAVPVSMIVELPESISFEDAAALPVAGITAYRALVSRGRLKRGEHVLVTGIGGGVATLAMLFAQALGAQVSVTSGSDEKLAKARELGAIAAANYKAKGWEKDLVAQAGRPPALIIDGAGGDGLNTLIGAAAPAGRIVMYGATRMSPSKLDMAKIFFKQLDLLGTTMGTDDEFRAMVKLVAEHRIKPVIDRIFPLSQAVEANRLLEQSAQMGKILLDCRK
ncbi:MAG TPA: zinc-binding dehydrogenase [Myxococcales bacterium]|jgi:NADPH:quinone reductase-like Zn-dependent oxidoreductase|nr:zinc-binding dehydrogenase [Myxococcales bacterium]